MATIKIDNTIYKYKKTSLYLGKKKINIEVAKRNLIDFNSLMKIKQLPFTLAYGTLLGVIRENNFIKHDEDIDINMLYEDKTKFLNYLFDLRKIGFEVARYDNRGFISIIRDNEYIDICFFKQETENIYECCGNFLLKRWLTDVISFQFIENEFLIPKDYIEFLRFYYGNNWQTPIEYTYNSKSLFMNKTMVFFKSILPDFINKIYLRYKAKKLKAIFLNKIQTEKI